MKQQLYILLQRLVPQHTLSRFAGLMANNRRPWLKNLLINWFIKKYQVNMSEAVQADPSAYFSFNDFFTRSLKANTRPICLEENSIISPVDGIICQSGFIKDNRLIQAKKFSYTIDALLGYNKTSNQYLSFLQGGSFATFYLAPKDYHRVHMPIAGRLKQMIYIPGKLFSVNQISSNCIQNLFTRNERLICFFETDAGTMVIVLVGAMIVASIHTTWAGKIISNKTQIWDYSNKDITLPKGAELGHFELGSTVIVLFGKNKAIGFDKLIENKVVRFGQKIGEINPS